MYTPEEIKKLLSDYKNYTFNLKELLKNSLEYILQLEREQDAAVNNLHGMCGACIRHNNDDDEIYVCSKYVECVHGIGDDEGEDYWQWRGVWEVE